MRVSCMMSIITYMPCIYSNILLVVLYVYERCKAMRLCVYLPPGSPFEQRQSCARPDRQHHQGARSLG